MRHGDDHMFGISVSSRSDAAQLQLKVSFDVNLDETRQQSCSDHLLERFAVAWIWCICQVDDAPEVQRHLLRPAHGMSDVKEWLVRTRHDLVAVFVNHPQPS